MTRPTMDPLAFLRKAIEDADSDLLREMVRTFAETLMSAEASAIAGAAYGERSPERTSQRNGYRARRWDTRTGSETPAGGGERPREVGIILAS